MWLGEVDRPQLTMCPYFTWEARLVPKLLSARWNAEPPKHTDTYTILQHYNIHHNYSTTERIFTFLAAVPLTLFCLVDTL